MSEDKSSFFDQNRSFLQAGAFFVIVLIILFVAIPKLLDDTRVVPSITSTEQALGRIKNQANRALDAISADQQDVVQQIVASIDHELAMSANSDTATNLASSNHTAISLARIGAVAAIILMLIHAVAVYFRND